MASVARSPITGASVLVTGGTGAFGQSFVRRCLQLGARRVAILSRDEAKQSRMRAELTDPRLRFLIGDVRDAKRMLDACRGVGIVVHAAALKRVEVCEEHPDEAVATNITGTLNVARACVERGVSTAVLLSTDKAAHPATLYGMTKGTAERGWLAFNTIAAGAGTSLVATRYGNVLGSTGSVLPLWRQQFAERKPITITDVRATRFWMTMDYAVDLVLLAIADAKAGETFVPMLGGSSVLDLARSVVEVEGVYAPGHVETGLRPGEKLHETLVTEDEARRTYDCGNRLVIAPDQPTWGEYTPPLWSLVPEGFTYRSDTVRPFTVSQLREMAA